MPKLKQRTVTGEAEADALEHLSQDRLAAQVERYCDEDHDVEDLPLIQAQQI